MSASPVPLPGWTSSLSTSVSNGVNSVLSLAHSFVTDALPVVFAVAVGSIVIVMIVVGLRMAYGFLQGSGGGADDGEDDGYWDSLNVWGQSEDGYIDGEPEDYAVADEWYSMELADESLDEGWD